MITFLWKYFIAAQCFTQLFNRRSFTTHFFADSIVVFLWNYSCEQHKVIQKHNWQRWARPELVFWTNFMRDNCRSWSLLHETAVSWSLLHLFPIFRTLPNPEVTYICNLRFLSAAQGTLKDGGDGSPRQGPSPTGTMVFKARSK